MALFLEEDKTLNQEIMEMFSMHKDSWSGLHGWINATRNTMEFEEGIRPIHQQPYLV